MLTTNKVLPTLPSQAAMGCVTVLSDVLIQQREKKQHVYYELSGIVCHFFPPL